MSKVQSPKSETRETETSSPNAPVASADVGHWTLHVGQSQADVRHSTLDFGLSITDLRKSFPTPAGERIEVLRGVSFSAGAGEAISIMGASGAGKSTFLQLICGLEAADHGSILAGQFAVDRATSAALARFRNQQVGFVFQFHHLLPDLTAAENVSLPLLITRTRRSQAMQRATQMLAEVGFDRRMSASVVGRLSGGEQQRVAVCRALIARPALVLADEPTGNLDMATGDEIARSLISYARDRGAVVIIATHNRALAERCDRTLVLRDGRLSAA
jgi:lipoprotein-releasing system ATP-binding protein